MGTERNRPGLLKKHDGKSIFSQLLSAENKQNPWEEAFALHTEAVSLFADTVGQISPDKWNVSKQQDQWTPAHVLEHLNLAHKILLQELNSGAGMSIRTKFLQRFVLRLVLVPKLLRGAPFPKGARAPRETRPDSSQSNQQAAVTSFQELARAFQETIMRVHRENPDKKLTHAYFGSSSLTDAVLLCARHIQHHQRQVLERVNL